MNTINKVFEFGKIDFNGKGRKVHRVSVEVNLREEDTNYGYKYYSFTASGEIWNARGTDCVVCGQCLDEILLCAPLIGILAEQLHTVVAWIAREETLFVPSPIEVG